MSQATRQLRAQLQEARDVLRAIAAGQVDSIIMADQSGPVLLEAAADALQASELRYRAMFDAALDAILVADDDGVYVEANPAASELLGMPREEIVGRTAADIVEGPFDFRSAWADFLARGRMRGDFTIVRPDGSRRFAEFAAVANVLPGRHISFLRDVTERRIAEEKTAALQEQLHHGNKLEAIGRLAAGIAHDFNNLLVVVLGYSQLLASELEPGTELSSYAQQIAEAGEQARLLVAQILAFGRRQMLHITPLDLDEIVARMQPLLRRAIREDIALALELESSLPVIEADATQLQQAIMNLVVNARDALPRGGRIILRTSVVDVNAETHGAGDRSGPHVRLSVIDDGLGMDSATLDRAFEPFFTTKSRGAGTGLGLSSVYGTVQQLGGFVTLESTLGEGTQIDLHFPAQAGVTPSPVRRPRGREGSRPPGNAAILVVEDNALVREIVERVLSSAGHRVVTAASGTEALQLLGGSDGFDLLLTDVVMPEMSGVELAEKVRSSHPDMRVLFLSGHAEEALEAHGLLDPETTLVIKPFSASALRKRVMAALSD